MSKESALASVVTPTTTPSSPQQPQADAGQSSSPSTQLASTPFSHLAQKEAQLVKQREAFKIERQQIEAEKAKLQTVQAQLRDYEEKKKTDPVAALKMIGFTESDIFNYMANQQKPEPTPEERAALAAEAAADAKIKAFEQSQNLKLQQEQLHRDNGLIKGYKTDINKVLRANPEKFEYCNHYGPMAEQLMYETAVAVVVQSKGQDVLTPLEVAEMVEEYYEEQDKSMSSLRKRQPKTPLEQPRTEPTRSRTVTPAPGAEPQKPTITRSRTLTNAATSTIASTRLRTNETREQKRERLVEALRNGAKL